MNTVNCAINGVAVPDTAGAVRELLRQRGVALGLFGRAFDEYPFILLNLVLSFQAAYAAPFIMMSQNRQSAIDRADAKSDYDVNLKAELEIELLHQKVDLMRENEMAELIQLIRSLEARLAATQSDKPA